MRVTLVGNPTRIGNAPRLKETGISTPIPTYSMTNDDDHSEEIDIPENHPLRKRGVKKIRFQTAGRDFQHTFYCALCDEIVTEGGTAFTDDDQQQAECIEQMHAFEHTPQYREVIEEGLRRGYHIEGEKE